MYRNCGEHPETAEIMENGEINPERSLRKLRPFDGEIWRILQERQMEVLTQEEFELLRRIKPKP